MLSVHPFGQIVDRFDNDQHNWQLNSSKLTPVGRNYLKEVMRHNGYVIDLDLSTELIECLQTFKGKIGLVTNGSDDFWEDKSVMDLINEKSVTLIPYKFFSNSEKYCRRCFPIILVDGSLVGGDLNLREFRQWTKKFLSSTPPPALGRLVLQPRITLSVN